MISTRRWKWVLATCLSATLICVLAVLSTMFDGPQGEENSPSGGKVEAAGLAEKESPLARSYRDSRHMLIQRPDAERLRAQIAQLAYLVNEHPDDPIVAQALHRLGALCRQAGDSEGALGYFGRVAGDAQAHPVARIFAMQERKQILHENERWAAAVQESEAILETWESAIDSNHPLGADPWGEWANEAAWLAREYGQKGMVDQAAALYERVVEILGTPAR